MLELSRQVHIQSRLRFELRSLSSMNSNHDTLISAKELDSIELLDGIIKESLRLRPTFSEGQPRITSPATMSSLGDFNMIAPNTRINAYPWLLHRNPAIFLDPETWCPERWMRGGADDKMQDEKEQWFWAFGKGPRACIGNHLVMQGKSSAPSQL